MILSSQRVALTEALYTAGKQKGQQAQAASPLVVDGQKLIPAVTRVFSKAKALYIYLQAYQQGDAQSILSSRVRPSTWTDRRHSR